MSSNPYEVDGFYASAIAAGRHRDIVGGRWEETGRIGLALLKNAGLLPHHQLLDIGAGALRLGCKLVPYLDAGHYWATDASRDILLAGHRAELAQPERLDPAQLIEDAHFAFPGVPQSITHAIAFAVFPHLTRDHLERALISLQRFRRLECFLFTVFLAPDAARAQSPYRQPDGVVTHRGRAPYHLLEIDVQTMAQRCGWTLTRSDAMLPRGQVLFLAVQGHA
ncbi:MAG: class I SAM-dependent methyltransferase [Rhodobacteraceae bacterium]|nr:MAG: class I SAM-dependent methyltransferase [Paracoccaceae bacterium]